MGFDYIVPEKHKLVSTNMYVLHILSFLTLKPAFSGHQRSIPPTLRVVSFGYCAYFNLPLHESLEGFLASGAIQHTTKHCHKSVGPRNTLLSDEEPKK